MLTTYSRPPGDPPDVPIHAFAGADDRSASVEMMSPWRPETTGRFQLDVVGGGHFSAPRANAT